LTRSGRRQPVDPQSSRPAAREAGAKSFIPLASNRLLIRLIIIASVMAGAFELGEWLQTKGILPFGFRYQFSGQGLIKKGSLNKIQQPGLARILQEGPAPRRIFFASEIYAARPGRIFFHVTRPECVAVMMDGKSIQIGTRKFFIPLVLKKGFNPIIIRYTLPAENPAGLHVAFSENATLLPFPYFRLVWPGKPFSLAKIAFYLIRSIDIGRTLVFALVLLFVFFRLPHFFRQRQNLEASRPVSVFQLLLQLFINTFSLFNISVFCFYMLQARIPLSVFFWGSIIIGFFLLFLACKKRTPTFALNRKKAGAFLGISAIVLLLVFFTCGSFLPLEPIGYGDLNAHLRMIKSIQLQGHFLEEASWRIYPQSLHASIVSGARILGLQPEEWITPFLMIMLVLLMFSIYLLGDELFPGIPMHFWVMALGISNSIFIFGSMFGHYSFPAIIAVSLFFFSLFFHMRKAAISSSLSLAASLVIYPYFAPAFLVGIIIFFFWLASPLVLKKWLQLAANLLPSLVAMAIYISVYITQGFLQQKEGFVTAYLLNPFFSLRFWNTALILVAIVFCFNLKNAKQTLGLFSAIVCGFLINYIPYAFFHAVSTYYVMKNMILLIAAGVLYSAAALFFMVRKFQKKWLLPFILSLALLVSIFQNAAKTPPRVSRGTTAVSRWLLKHTPYRDAISMKVAGGDLFQFFLQTLGMQRKLIYVAADAAADPSRASWLVIDRSVTAASEKGKSREKLAEFDDFSIYKLDETSMPTGK